MHLALPRDPGQRMMTTSTTERGELLEDAQEMGVDLVRTGQAQPDSRVRNRREGVEMKTPPLTLRYPTVRVMKK